MRAKSIWHRGFISLISSLVLVAASSLPALSTIWQVSYTFNSSNELTNKFYSYVSSGSVSQSMTGGIGNTGAIYAPGSANAVFATKESYSLAGAGTIYEFTVNLQSVGNSGHGGLGFTTYVPGPTTVGGTQFRPNDALGVSVDGGGFVFHNGGTNYSGTWSGGGVGISSVQTSSTVNLLDDGSPSDWYEVILKVTQTAGSQFSMEVSVWPTNDNGERLGVSAAAIYRISNLTNSTIQNAPSMRSYLNFSGDRVRYFDDLYLELSGGSTPVTEGYPVVLTGVVTSASGVISAAGSVSSGSGAAITERGFVLAKDFPFPTTNNTKLVVSGTTGAMSANSAPLSSGSYTVRAFATNSRGTSYGIARTLTVVGASFTITFDANGGTGSMSNQTASTSTALTTNSFTRSGFTFDGWNTEANGTGTDYADGANYAFTANDTLYAQWVANTFTVTFDANGGTGSMSNQTASTSTALTTNSFTRSGFTFDGWNTEANGTGTDYADGANYAFTANDTLYAQWLSSSPAAGPTYVGPIITNLALREVSTNGGQQVEILGMRLGDISLATIDGKSLQIISKTDTSLLVVLPDLLPGKKNLVITWGNGILIHQDAFEVIQNLRTPSPLAADTKVNAGSFKGYVAIYARGYEGSRLSAKVGNDWVVVPSIVNNQANGTLFRAVEFTGAGYTIAVRIYVNRVLVDTITVTTK